MPIIYVCRKECRVLTHGNSGHYREGGQVVVRGCAFDQDCLEFMGLYWEPQIGNPKNIAGI